VSGDVVQTGRCGGDDVVLGAGRSDLHAIVQATTIVQVTATVDDGDLAVYPVTAFVERRAGRWLVTHVGDD
jgi:hypothetical protein